MIDFSAAIGHSSGMNKTETNNTLSDREKLAQLRLIRTEGVGPVMFRGLLEKFGNVLTALDGAVELSKKNGRRKPLVPPSEQACEAELDRLGRFGATALFLGAPDYPEKLAATEDAPPVLFVKGRLELLENQAVGIVGARNASVSGIKFTKQVAHDLAEAGVTVVSGLARGIDTAAHQASLEAGTVACVAGGLDIHYPPENETLQQHIGETGLLISEMPMGIRPQARHFPRRNRLISGLSDGVLVVEAAIKSGSLITARFALEQGRDVFAVPGSPLDPRAAGGNRLIRDGARLVEQAADILDELQAAPPKPVRPVAHVTPVTTAKVSHMSHPIVTKPANGHAPAISGGDSLLSMLSGSPVHMDDIVRTTGASADEVMATLLDLELAGKITRHTGGRISRIYDE